MTFLLFRHFASDRVLNECDAIGEIEIANLMVGALQSAQPASMHVCYGELGAWFNCEDSHLAENLNVYLNSQVFDAADGEGAGVVPGDDACRIA